jgi:hypothetical protein
MNKTQVKLGTGCCGVDITKDILIDNLGQHLLGECYTDLEAGVIDTIKRPYFGVVPKHN